MIVARPAPGEREAFLRVVRAACGKAEIVEDGHEAIRIVAESSPRFILISCAASAEDALMLLAAIRRQDPAATVAVHQDPPSAEWAVRFVKAGAWDYVSGPLDEAKLKALVVAAGRNSPWAPGEGDFQDVLPSCPPGVGLVGRSQAVARALEMTRIVAQSRCNPVLILGETGAGKELIARAVHAWRCGAERSMVAVNCAALTPTLLESELFGHVRGAFTGADREKTGLLEAAGSGSVFLDEISEMPLELQAKLLRFLQEKTFRKVGGTADIVCKATILASSNLALFEETITGKFRRDLYYRLAVFPIKVPPLRAEDRKDDIPLLARHFLREFSPPGRAIALGPAAEEALLRHDWPGNVRELRNVMERAALLEKTDTVQPSSLFIETIANRGNDSSGPGGSVVTCLDLKDYSIEAAEKELIAMALRESNGQRTLAASRLGITRATLYAKIKRYALQ
jgi:two-component system, NtrC family, response regulator HydG